MASTTHSSVTKTKFSKVNDDGFDRHSHHLPSRLSVCNSSFTGDDHGFLGPATMSMSALSIDSFDADVDLSAAPDSGKVDGQRSYFHPATPPRRRRRRAGAEKDYLSENEAQEGSGKRVPSGRNGRRSGGSPSGGGGAAGVVAITRPKGGSKSLRMDLEEVKACHELGFELEDKKTLEVLPTPSAASSSSGRSVDYQSSSGGNSPISSWCISSPDDNPKEVKARLKVWAQAVALFSTSTKFNSNFR